MPFLVSYRMQKLIPKRRDQGRKFFSQGLNEGLIKVGIQFYFSPASGGYWELEQTPGESGCLPGVFYATGNRRGDTGNLTKYFT